ncbi:MAG: hypothetical protein HYW48_02960 [Deltaproteobacteria bacterium]|nr:hypothetical protein [Deltaproteobacteria bacterium]
MANYNSHSEKRFAAHNLGGKTKTDLKPCCSKTIQTLVANNPMMSCHECKSIIKVFKEENAFNNFVKFCELRGRNIEVAEIEGYKVVIFQSYHP